MADVELVIKIPEEDYHRIASGFGQEEDAVLLEKIFKNGIPLDSVLDEVRERIEQEYNLLRATRADETLELGECLGLKISLMIIDKYRK